MKDLKTEIQRKIGKKRLFYVCRDIERAAAGLLLDLPNFYIITNDGPYARELERTAKDCKIIRVKNKEQLDTFDLLARCHSRENGNPDTHQCVRLDPRRSLPRAELRGGDDKLTIEPGDLVMVFKPTKQIELVCKKNGWKLLNPPSELASRVEEKISQVRWLGPLKKYLPNYIICECGRIKWPGKKFVIQFNHSHTGSGTLLVSSPAQLTGIQKKFPMRPARYARYISGPLFTNNNIVWGEKILVGNISYQITGLKPFTNNEFATIGNDWAVTNKILDAKQINQYKAIATAVGKRLASSGWKGLFGIDVIVDEKSGQLYLLEINARQPASTTYESELQAVERGTRNGGTVASPSFQEGARGELPMNYTTFEAHLAALLGIKYSGQQLITIGDGSQVILRKNSNEQLTTSKTILDNDFKIIEYPQPKECADWLRIQSANGIMAKHNIFNKIGNRIVKLIHR